MFAPLLRRLKGKIIFRVTKNDDIEFYWLIATAYFEIYEAEMHQELLYKIVEAYDNKMFFLCQCWAWKIHEDL